MSIFDRFKKQKHEKQHNNDIEAFAQRNCAATVSFAKEFGKELDYSPKSIADLEEILDFYSKDLSKSNPTENQIWSMSVIFGSYLGETMLKNGLFEKGYAWETDGSSHIPLLLRPDGSCVAPNDKVYKRLINGKTDDVISFYDIAMKTL